MNLSALQKKIHTSAKEHGWWETPRSFLEVLMLIVSEVAEAAEEYRNGHAYTEIYYNDSALEVRKPEGIPIELADIAIRLLDCCETYGINLEMAMDTKMLYNKQRPYRHGGKLA